MIPSSFYVVITTSLVIMALYSLYLEHKIKTMRGDLTKIAKTFYDLLIVLDAHEIITIKEEGEGDVE